MRRAHDIEAVLFDVGDTLIHFTTSRASHFLEAAAVPAHRMLREWGFDVPSYLRYRNAIKRAFLWPYLWSLVRRREVQIVPAFDRCHRRMGVHLDDARLSELHQVCIDSLRPFMKLDPNAENVVDQLHRCGLKLGLVSNTPFPAHAIDEFLEDQGLLKYFPVRVYSSDVRYRKPDPRIFTLAIQQIGVAAERTLFVGDRMDNDVWGPARVGMKTALFLQNGDVQRGRRQPDYILRELTDLAEIVQAPIK